MTDEVITIDRLAPTFKGFFGGETGHPEWCGTSCDECGTHGYIHEGDADYAMQEDLPTLCEDCAA